MRRHLWLAVVVFVLIIAAAAVATAARRSSATAAPVRAAAQAARYACPMHPEVTSASRTKCPECGMPLAPTGR
jgi:hypothetical protein